MKLAFQRAEVDLCVIGHPSRARDCIGPAQESALQNADATRGSAVVDEHGQSRDTGYRVDREALPVAADHQQPQRAAGLSDIALRRFRCCHDLLEGQP